MRIIQANNRGEELNKDPSFWFHPRVTDYYTLKLYQWLKTCYLEGINIDISSRLWCSHIETKELEIESYKILQPFRKPKVYPTYRPSIQVDLDCLTYLYQRNFHNNTIDTIELILHPVEEYTRQSGAYTLLVQKEIHSKSTRNKSPPEYRDTWRRKSRWRHSKQKKSEEQVHQAK